MWSSRKHPALNDVTTDAQNPPAMVGAAENAQPRQPIRPPIRRRGLPSLQQASYPDIKTLVVPRPAEETFELVLQAIGKLKMRSAYEAPPDEEPGAPGVVEIADKTMVLGFTDDVVIRIAGDEAQSRVDVRSSSRYGTIGFWPQRRSRAGNSEGNQRTL